jgi:hypothetical protein
MRQLPPFVDLVDAHSAGTKVLEFIAGFLGEKLAHQIVFDEPAKEEDGVIGRVLFGKPMPFDRLVVILRFVVNMG